MTEKIPVYLMNTETREIFPYTKFLAEMKSPVFVPYEGKLPTPDLERGVPVAPLVGSDGIVPEPTPLERVKMIAGALPIVPKEDITAGGNPGLLALEKLTGLSDIKRKEVNDAKTMRLEYVSGRTAPPEDPHTGLPQDGVDPETGEEIGDNNGNPAEV